MGQIKIVRRLFGAGSEEAYGAPVGSPYWTPVERAGGRRWVAATLASPGGAVVGPRYTTEAACARAVAYHETSTGDATEAMDEAEAATVRAAEAEDAALRASLVAAGGVLRAAAETLGISYATIKRRVGRAGLTAWLRETYPLGVRQPAREGRPAMRNRPDPC